MVTDVGSTAASTGTGPEHEQVRMPLVKKLQELGWKDDQIQWTPEWRVPKSPSEHSRRELGQSYSGFPVDIVLWDSPARAGDPEAALVIFETKKPDATEGRLQLEHYLSLEYTVKMGFWTNGTETLAIYRLPSGKFSHHPGAAIPQPNDRFYSVGDEPLRYTDLFELSPANLRAKLNRLFNVVAAGDTVSTRPDQRLNQLCNLLLVKLASDQSGKHKPDDDLVFQPVLSEQETAQRIRAQYGALCARYPRVFHSNEDAQLAFDDYTIQEICFELASIKLVDVTPETISEAFQVFRAANLKAGEGQYFTPSRVVRSAVELMEIQYEDRIVDPACGTGGFLVEAFLALGREVPSLTDAEQQKWAHDQVFGVDRDDINVKLARAIMQIIGDGSSNIETGDSLRADRWERDYPGVERCLTDETFTCVITNPPFGRSLRLPARDGRVGGYTITKKGGNTHNDLEIGLVFLERCYKLLVDHGRLGIILPETYWFSQTYRWLREWLQERFVLRGMFNIPMEAFQSFCRAKTNFYILEKIPHPDSIDTQHQLMPYRPSWYVDGAVVTSSATTCGIDKDGIERVLIGPTEELDGDALFSDIRAIRNKSTTPTTSVVPIADVIDPWRAVPSHYDARPLIEFEEALGTIWPGWSAMQLGELIEIGWVVRRDGHGSPGKDDRTGEVPYIKVSDLRAGLVNVNPTNMVPRTTAEGLWRNSESGLQAFDLLSPERASANIGEFCVLMPGQENIVVTREVIILRVTDEAAFDSFFLLWALSLRVVRDQWRRLVFMQTNREDVGHRYREILIPVPIDRKSNRIDTVEATEVSESFRSFFQGMSDLRAEFTASLSSGGVHHFALATQS